MPENPYQGRCYNCNGYTDMEIAHRHDKSIAHRLFRGYFKQSDDRKDPHQDQYINDPQQHKGKKKHIGKRGAHSQANICFHDQKDAQKQRRDPYDGGLLKIFFESIEKCMPDIPFFIGRLLQGKLEKSRSRSSNGHHRYGKKQPQQADA